MAFIQPPAPYRRWSIGTCPGSAWLQAGSREGGPELEQLLASWNLAWEAELGSHSHPARQDLLCRPHDF